MTSLVLDAFPDKAGNCVDAIDRIVIRIVNVYSYEMLYGAELYQYSGGDKSLARPGRKQTLATEDFDVHLSSL